ncbi:FecR family protein [Ichthyenterobacterium sp. W332]|uniref:FecR family protein n=1 Tax=Microcosmobacter mediterraneus TaxID=3075607 RepID=A0ABU2YK24_9FLAO|nr:FecR family protein [Ichthyenterobacterium sp. W332]MDT0558167.1 FecR family protein [Ichthyenterobacterium sp. W332]
MNTEELLEKWLSNTLTDAEQTAFDRLDDASLNKAIVEGAKHFKASNFSEVNDFMSFENSYLNSTDLNPKPRIWETPLFKIAAVFLISLGLFFTIFQKNEIEIKTLASEKIELSLPDQSSVKLNALSELTYNKKTWSEKRALQLKGEAYFKVTKGSTFDVITDDGTVTVVGTEFNVKQRLNYFEVTCYEGIVKVTTPTNEKRLNAGDSFLLLNNNFKTAKTFSTVPDWTENRSTFNAIPLSEVLQEIERQYTIEITSLNIDTNRLFTGSFTHNNLEDALKSVTLPMNMSFELSKTKQVIINGNKD